MDEQVTENGLRLTRRRLLLAAGGAAAAAGLASLPGCGEGDDTHELQSEIAGADVDAPQIRDNPHAPAQAPLNCQILGFFTLAEARAVEAFTARLIPGSPDDPGAREACVTHFIDRKLSEFETFATTTYFQPPFAAPAKGRPAGYDNGTIYVSEAELARYGFQSDLTPQRAYRLGLAELDRYSHEKHGAAFVDLPEKTQDAILTLLEADAIESFEKPGGGDLFAMLQEDTNEGMFADPLYGGNRDFAGWKLIGYPGAQRAYTPEELKSGPNRRRVQGLLDMPPMHAGRPEEHVILPIAGTDRVGD